MWVRQLKSKSIAIEKEFVLNKGYVAHDFAISDWANGEFIEKAAKVLS
jgi:hypothetical protein